MIRKYNNFNIIATAEKSKAHLPAPVKIAKCLHSDDPRDKQKQTLS